MAWFSRSNTENKLDELDHKLSASFSSVKQDTQKIFSWLTYLYNQNIEQEKKITLLQDQLSTNKQQIYEVVEDFYLIKQITQHINYLHKKMDSLHASHSELNPKFEELRNKLSQLEVKRQDVKANLKEKLLQKITKNSKEYVKNIILTMIRKYEKISALQLKEMVVDEQGLCSKSSFYRILAEIEKNPEISLVMEGKEKLFFL